MAFKRRANALSLLAVLLWMLVIFSLSAQPAGYSNANSKGMITRVVNTVTRFTKADITETEKMILTERINSVARECMHGVVFLVLGVLTQNAVAKLVVPKMKAAAITLAVCLAYGLTDEFHQLFVPGRAFQISDLAMDAVGSVIGICLILLQKGVKE